MDLTIDDFQATSDRVPFIADLKPSGKYVMEDVHKVGRDRGFEPGCEHFYDIEPSCLGLICLSFLERNGADVNIGLCCFGVQVGGVPAVLKYLLQQGYIDGSCLTVTGDTWTSFLRSIPALQCLLLWQRAQCAPLPCCYWLLRPAEQSYRHA